MAQSISQIEKKILVRIFFLFVIIILIGLGEERATADEGRAAPMPASAIQLSLKDLRKDELISVDELRDLQIKQTDFVLFDARARRSYQTAHIEGAVLPLTSAYYTQDELFRNKIIASAPDRAKALSEATQNYSKDTPIVTYCNRNCSASTVLLLDLKRLGFMNVRAMEDGMQAWEEKNYPMAVGA